MVFSCRTDAFFPGVHKIGAAIFGPRIADKHFTDTKRIFLTMSDLPCVYQQWAHCAAQGWPDPGRPHLIRPVHNQHGCIIGCHWWLTSVFAYRLARAWKRVSLSFFWGSEKVSADRVAAIDPPIDDTDPIRNFSIDPESHTDWQNPAEFFAKGRPIRNFSIDPTSSIRTSIADAIFADAISETPTSGVFSSVFGFLCALSREGCDPGRHLQECF